MKTRPPSLQSFIDCLRLAFDAAEHDSEVARVAGTIFEALKLHGEPGTALPLRQAACLHLEEVLQLTNSAVEPVLRLGQAFATLQGQLHWAPRPASGPNASANWANGHANVIIIGPGGLEQRDDVAIGATVMAPHVRYPDHDHLPEEIYLVVTPGRFRHGRTPWVSPGVGGTFHNVPSITHAMASGEAAFLTFWCLLLAPNARSGQELS